MLFLRTGLPGASKTLNTLREICHEPRNSGREIYYHNIKILLLDLEVCHSFEGYFYGFYHPGLDKKTKASVNRFLKTIHDIGEFASLKTFPQLAHVYDAWLESGGPVSLFLKWVNTVYPDSARKNLQFYLDSVAPELPSIEALKQFNLDWRRFENPALWHDLPRQSIIVMDECQQTFPPRPVGSKVPVHCSEFETHRHKGWDIHLVTQDAKLLDNHVRRLAGCHIHYYNPFKGNRVTRYQGDKVFDQEDYFQKQKTISSIITRDKSLYGLYWSADIHTHKLVLPKKLILLIIFPFLIAWLFWYLISGAWSSNTTLSQPAEPQQQVSAAPHKSEKQPSVFPDIKPHSQIPADTPIGQLCQQFTYAGFELKKGQYGTYSAVHFFTCELPYSEDEAKNDENFVKPSLLVDGYYLNRLGFDFEFLNRMPVLTYNGTKYIFPRY